MHISSHVFIIVNLWSQVVSQMANIVHHILNQQRHILTHSDVDSLGKGASLGKLAQVLEGEHLRHGRVQGDDGWLIISLRVTLLLATFALLLGAAFFFLIVIIIVIIVNSIRLLTGIHGAILPDCYSTIAEFTFYRESHRLLVHRDDHRLA